MLVFVSTMPAGEKYLELAKEVSAFADFLHLDVCDGNYNNTICFLPEYAKQINDNTTLPLDCHLMTKTPLEYAKKYISAGANIITAQIESFDSEQEIKSFIEFVKTHNALVGLSIEPNTKIETVKPYLDVLDIVLVMSVQTGSSGQKFNSIAIKKIDELNSIRKDKNLNFKIEVDGGITDQNVNTVKLAGADIVVSGNFVYNAKNKNKAVNSLK